MVQGTNVVAKKKANHLIWQEFDPEIAEVGLVHDRLIDAGIRGGLVATVHDELLVECHADDAEQARDILQDAMIEAFAVTFPGAPLNGVAEAKIGTTWADAK